MKRKPILGETLYALNVGNAAGRGVPQTLKPVIVSKIGRKYFTCGPEGARFPEEYHIDTWREKTEFCVNHHLYETEQEWLDEKEFSETVSEIRAMFNAYNKPPLTLESLRKIKSVITTTPL